MEVTMKATETVRPARPTPLRKLWCSNLDLLVPRGHVATVFIYRSDGSPDFFDTSMLKAALAEVLVTYYPAAGRVGMDGSGRLEIDCNGEGVVFVEAEANVGLDEFGDFGPENGPKFMQLVPHAAAFSSEQDVSACPILLLQVTRFRCGGASLGVAADHLLGDGLSAFNLINSWADITRGGGGGTGVPVVPPFVDRTVLAARDPPMPSFPHPECSVPQTTNTQPPEPAVAARFRLTRAEIDRLKAKGANKAAGRWCSSYEAIVAHTWRCACIARELPADQKTRVYMPVGLQGRLDPPLPPNYLGNAIIHTVCDATAGEVTGDSIELEQVVSKVHGALAKVDDAYLRSAIDYLQLQPDLSKLRRGPAAYGCPNLDVVSWVKLPIQDVDFGWGRRTFMGPAKVICEGMVIILPQPAADDGLSLVIMLQPEAMQRFKKVFYDF